MLGECCNYFSSRLVIFSLLLNILGVVITTLFPALSFIIGNTEVNPCALDKKHFIANCVQQIPPVELHFHPFQNKSGLVFPGFLNYCWHISTELTNEPLTSSNDPSSLSLSHPLSFSAGCCVMISLAWRWQEIQCWPPTQYACDWRAWVSVRWGCVWGAPT